MIKEGIDVTMSLPPIFVRSSTFVRMLIITSQLLSLTHIASDDSGRIAAGDLRSVPRHW